MARAGADEGAAASVAALALPSPTPRTPWPAYIPKSPNQISIPLTSTKYRTTKIGERATGIHYTPSASLYIEKCEFAEPNRRRADEIALGACRGAKRRGEEDEKEMNAQKQRGVIPNF
jgi:hypothetical protein